MKSKLCMIAFMFSLIITGCGPAQENDKQRMGEAVDNIRVENYFELGPNREYFPQRPERVLVIGAAQTEALLDLGVEDTILYAVKYEDNPVFSIKESNKKAFDRLDFLPRQEMNMEKVLTIHPDLIVSEESWYSKNHLGSTDYWNSRNVHTMVTLNTTSPSKSSEPETVEKEMKYISDLGLIFRKEKQAKKITEETWRRINDVREQTSGQKKPKVMILDLLSTTISFGKNKIAGNIAYSLGANVPETTAAVSDEQIMKENPDVVFVVTYGDASERIERIRKKVVFSHLNFAKNNRIYPIPLKYAYGPVTRTIDAAGYMAERIYPGQFSFEKEYNFYPHGRIYETS